MDSRQGDPHRLKHPPHNNEVGSIVVIESFGLGIGVQLVEGAVERCSGPGEQF